MNRPTVLQVAHQLHIEAHDRGSARAAMRRLLMGRTGGGPTRPMTDRERTRRDRRRRHEARHHDFANA